MGILNKKNIQVPIKIPKGFTKQERLSIASDILNYIRDTASSGYSPIDGSRFVKYTKEYSTKKGSKFVDLTLSGKMLDAIKLLKEKDGQLVIGYNVSDKEAGKAEGNQIGSYGQPSPNSEKERPFIGINDSELETILKQHGSDELDNLRRLQNIEVAARESVTLNQNQRISEEALTAIQKRVKFR